MLHITNYFKNFFLLIFVLLSFFSCEYRKGLEEYIKLSGPVFTNYEYFHTSKPCWEWEEIDGVKQFRYSQDKKKWKKTDKLRFKISDDLETGSYTLYVQAKYNEDRWSKTQENTIIVLNNLCVSSTNGDDSNPGTPDLPVRSIKKALDIITANPGRYSGISLENGIYSPTNQALPNIPGSSAIDLSTMNNFMLLGGWNSDFNEISGTSVLDGENSLKTIISINTASYIELSNLQLINSVDNAFVVNNAEYLTINNCSFKKNSSTLNGAGLNITNSRKFSIKSTLVQNNSITNSTSGGGIFLLNCSDFNIKNSTIEGNTIATGNGGGIFIQSGYNALIEDCYIENNKTNSGIGGGISIYNHNDLKIVNCQINGNSAKDGGGIYISQSNNSTYTNNSISRNKCTNFGTGAALFIQNSNYNNFKNCLIQDNNGYSNNSMINIDAADNLVFEYCIFTHANSVSMNSKILELRTSIDNLTIINNTFGGFDGTKNECAIYENNQVINHTLSNNKFLTATLKDLYFDTTEGFITDVNLLNDNSPVQLNKVGAATAGGNH